MKLDFTTEQLTTIDKALQQLPFYLAQPLFADINKQLAAQQDPINAADIQKAFDAQVDAHDMPSGATKQPDPYTGD